MKFIEKIRPNMLAGLICLLAIALAASLALPPDESKEVLLLVAGGLIGVLKDLLGADRA